MDLGLTQHTLADRLRCSYSTVAAWENDGCEPLARQWPAIEAVLGSALVPEWDGLPGRIRTARLRLGLTHAALAFLAGLDVRTIHNSESGTYRPCRATLGKLRAILGDSLLPLCEERARPARSN